MAKGNVQRDAAHEGGSSPHLFTQLADALREKIYSREWKSGERIPSEHELMEHYGVSRGTARRAIGVLVDEGMLEQRHGSGTYVTGPTLVHAAGVRPISFAESLRRQGKTFETRVLTKELLKSPDDVAEVLGISPKDPVMFMRRVRSVSGKPVLCQESWTNLSLCPGIEEMDFTRVALFDAVEERSQHKIYYTVQNYKALVAGREHADYLGCDETSAVLLLEQAIHLDNDDVVEWSFTWLPPGQTIVGRSYQAR